MMIRSNLSVSFGVDKEVPNIVVLGGNAIDSKEDVKVPLGEAIFAIITETFYNDMMQKERVEKHLYIVASLKKAQEVLERPEEYKLYEPAKFVERCQKLHDGLMIEYTSLKGKKYVREYTENDKVFTNSDDLKKAVMLYIDDYIQRKTAEEKNKEYVLK